jgi:hypothetical protein
MSLMDSIEITVPTTGINFPSRSPLGKLTSFNDPKIPPSLRLDECPTTPIFFPNQRHDIGSTVIGFILTSFHLGSGQSPKMDLVQECNNLSHFLRQEEMDQANGYMSGSGLFNLGKITLITLVPSTEIIPCIITGVASFGLRCECPQDANVVFLTADARHNQSPLRLNFIRVQRSHSHSTSIAFFQPSAVHVSNPSAHLRHCRRCIAIPEVLFSFLHIVKHVHDTQLVEMVCFVVGLCLAR